MGRTVGISEGTKVGRSVGDGDTPVSDCMSEGPVDDMALGGLVACAVGWEDSALLGRIDGVAVSSKVGP